MSTTVEAAAIQQAQDKAKQTGSPQPVTDKSGKIAYYLTPDGAEIPTNLIGYYDNPGAVTPVVTLPDGRQVHRDAQGNVVEVDSAAEVARQRAQDEQQRQQQQAQTQRQQDATGAGKLSAANALHGFVWINGHRATITGFDPKTGAPIVSYDLGAGKSSTTLPDDKSVDSVFGPVDSLHPGLDNKAMFSMSTGPVDIFAGPNTNAGLSGGFGSQLGNYTPAGVGMTPAAAEHSRSANVVTGSNQMTVGQGVQWFLNLSVQHPDQYQQLVNMLVAAHYVTPSLGESAGGGYSIDAAAGFAKATMELSSVQSTQGGKNTGLIDFLQQKAKAAQDAAAASVQPVTRNYQDPATLAYAARNAAQQWIGRNLTPAEQAAFDKSYRAQENAYYNNVDQTNQAQARAGVMNQTGPANTTPAPDTTGQAEQYLQGGQFDNQRNGYQMLEYVKALQDFLGNGKL